MRNGKVCRIPPTNVATPVMAPLKKGWPRPVNDPSSESPSENPILIAAPTAAARPTRKVIRGSPVANAVANSGASVETDPSMRPTRLGCTTFSTKFLLCPEAVISRPPNPSRSINAVKNVPFVWKKLTNPPQHYSRTCPEIKNNSYSLLMRIISDVELDGRHKRGDAARVGSGSRHCKLSCCCWFLWVSPDVGAFRVWTCDLLRRLVEVEVGLHDHLLRVAVEVEAEVSADALHGEVLEEDVGAYVSQAFGAAYR